MYRPNIRSGLSRLHVMLKRLLVPRRMPSSRMRRSLWVFALSCSRGGRCCHDFFFAAA